MLRAIIFDFNGVIADDETPHLLTFQQALKEHGFTLSKDEYYGRFLGMDERNCAEELIKVCTGKSDPTLLSAVLERKAILFRVYTAKHKPELFPGVVEFVKQAGERYRLAIASGGRREQIDYALKNTPIEEAFEVIVSAEDITVGKPDPQIYLLALKRLNEISLLRDIPHSIARSQNRQITKFVPSNCLVIEDSKAGIRSALTAGMKVIALSTTYSADQLVEAHAVLPGLEGLTLEDLGKLFRT